MIAYSDVNWLKPISPPFWHLTFRHLTFRHLTFWHKHFVSLHVSAYVHFGIVDILPRGHYGTRIFQHKDISELGTFWHMDVSARWTFWHNEHFGMGTFWQDFLQHNLVQEFFDMDISPHGHFSTSIAEKSPYRNVHHAKTSTSKNSQNEMYEKPVP